MDDVIAAIRAREAANGIRYEIIDLRDFANPIPAIMGRTPARGVSIGGDPFRTVLPLTDAEARMLAQTDLVLIPHLSGHRCAQEAAGRLFACL